METFILIVFVLKKEIHLNFVVEVFCTYVHLFICIKCINDVIKNRRAAKNQSNIILSTFSVFHHTCHLRQITDYWGHSTLSDKIFVGQNISTLLFDFYLTFVLKYWTKCFVGQNFRHQAEISTLLSDELLSDKVSAGPIG